MKREDILLYLVDNKVYVYLTKRMHLEVEELDTSLFFEFGEIKNVHLCLETLNKLFSKLKLGTIRLKPNFIVLYNDVSHSDIKYLYRSVLQGIEFNSVSFAPLSEVVRMVHDSERVIFADKNYYTIFKDNVKTTSLEGLDFEPILIGEVSDEYLHYSEPDIIFDTFKSCFTKFISYDNMDVGDDG